MYKKGDKVRVRADLEVGKKYNDITLLEGNMSACRGEVGTVLSTINNGDVYVHIPSVDCHFYFNNEMLEPVPSLAEIKEKNLKCVIKVDSEEEAVKLAEIFKPNGYDMIYSYNYLTSFYNKADGTVCFTISDDRITGFDTETYLKKCSEYGTIYNFKDLVQTGGVVKSKLELPKDIANDCVISAKDIEKALRNCEIKLEKDVVPIMNIDLAFNNKLSAKDAFDSLVDSWKALGKVLKKDEKEKKPMKEFGKVEGIRIDKTCNKKVEIVTTYASCPHGHATTVCDKVNYDAYMGALVAAAKITALKSNDAMRLYKLAINMWDAAMIIPNLTIAILKTLADEAFDGGFENAYKKWQRQIKAEEKAQTEKELRCSVCGKKFDTPEDARKHEQWHTDKKEAKKQRYLERCEAKRRIAEAERETRIKAYMDELAKDNK